MKDVEYPESRLEKIVKKISLLVIPAVMAGYFVYHSVCSIDYKDKIGFNYSKRKPDCSNQLCALDNYEYSIRKGIHYIVDEKLVYNRYDNLFSAVMIDDDHDGKLDYLYLVDKKNNFKLKANVYAWIFMNYEHKSLYDENTKLENKYSHDYVKQLIKEYSEVFRKFKEENKIDEKLSEYVKPNL